MTSKEFIECWQMSASIQEICNKTGKNTSSVKNRAYYLRKRGIPLKDIGTPYQKVDWEELRLYAASFNGIILNRGW